MITYATISEIGNRSNNEDYLESFVQNDQAFFALADGLGGHGKGEVASRIAVTEALECFKFRPDDLHACFAEGQNALMDAQREANMRNDAKTTLVCLRILGGKARWGHIGDSRLYRFSRNKLIFRTLDHSVPQMLVASGEIREKDIRHHEDRNRLLRVMGTEWSSPKYELADEIALASNDTFLLCTDGFWEWIEEKEMQRNLKSAKTPGEWLRSMVAVTERNSKGDNRDNYSAIAVFVR